MTYGPASKKDFCLVSVIGLIFALFALPILENTRPAFWHLTPFSALALVAGFVIFANFALAVASLIGRSRPGVFQFAKYAAAGAMNSFTDLGLFNLLSLTFGVYSGWPIVVFNTFSFLVAVSNSYFWNNLWVFRKEGQQLGLGQYLKFLGTTVGSVMIGSAIIYALTTAIGAPEGISPALWENIAKLATVPVSMTWNYLGYKFFVFK